MQQYKDIYYSMQEKRGLIMLSGLLVASLSFLFFIFHEKNFRAEADLLIVNNSKESQDYYSFAKNAEYMGLVLSEIVYSELFIDEVVKLEAMEDNLLPTKKKDRLTEWGKIVQMQRNPQTGIISVAVLHDNQNIAINVVEGIIEVFTQKNSLFRGDGQDIDIRVLSGPILERNPGVSSIAGIVIGGFIAGIFISSTYSVLSRKLSRNIRKKTREEYSTRKIPGVLSHKNGIQDFQEKEASCTTKKPFNKEFEALVSKEKSSLQNEEAYMYSKQ